MSSGDLETFLHELRALGDPVPQSRLLALLRSFTGQRIYFARRRLLLPEQVRLAATMLGSGMTRSECAYALVERLDVSEATAYRILARALDACAHRGQLELL